MLEKLGEVDWTSLGAPEIPNWLRGLASEDRLTRNTSLGKLYSCLAINESTNYALRNSYDFKYALRNNLPLLVTPFLTELLTSETVQAKYEILELLSSLAEFT